VSLLTDLDIGGLSLLQKLSIYDAIFWH